MLNNSEFFENEVATMKCGAGDINDVCYVTPGDAKEWKEDNETKTSCSHGSHNECSHSSS